MLGYGCVANFQQVAVTPASLANFPRLLLVLTHLSTHPSSRASLLPECCLIWLFWAVFSSAEV